jgi:hypothetical protein
MTIHVGPISARALNSFSMLLYVDREAPISPAGLFVLENMIPNGIYLS